MSFPALGIPGAERPSSPCILPQLFWTLSPRHLCHRIDEESKAPRADRTVGTGGREGSSGVSVGSRPPVPACGPARSPGRDWGRQGGARGVKSRGAQGRAHTSLCCPPPDPGPGTCRKEGGPSQRPRAPRLSQSSGLGQRRCLVCGHLQEGRERRPVNLSANGCDAPLRGRGTGRVTSAESWLGRLC